jgi:hypothetical protein
MAVHPDFYFIQKIRFKGNEIMDDRTLSNRTSAALEKVSPPAQKLYRYIRQNFFPRPCWMTKDNLAKAIGVRTSSIKALKVELEKAGLIHINYHPNGARFNPRHEIILTGRTGTPICKHINRVFAFKEWGRLDRNAQVECYLRSEWEVIPFEERGKRPIEGFEYAHWSRRSISERLDYFFNNPRLNIGLVVCNHTIIVDVDSKTSIWNEHPEFRNTLTVSTARGYQYYFRSDAVVSQSSAGILHGVDTRGSGNFVVLPPSIHPTGVPYEWETIARPAQLPFDFRSEWREAFFNHQRSYGNFEGILDSIPKGTRNDTLWRYGRSQRAQGKRFFDIEKEIREINRSRCQPPITGYELDELIEHIWDHPNVVSYRRTAPKTS